MSDNAISMRFWGIVGSSMLKVYVHLSEQMQAAQYRKSKGMAEEQKIINPLSLRCVNCGRLIQSGLLCKQCEDTKKLSDENQELKNKVDSMEQLINMIATKVDVGDIPRSIGMVKKYEKKEA